MKVYLNSIKVWLQGEDDDTQLSLWANGELALASEFTPPKPQYYPKAQLRRLSPFSKVVLHCLDIPQVLSENYPLIFASQHGDLAKTVNLIKDAAIGEDLSPTQFALSVHNATTGLFSIATKNTAATTTISAGSNTFVEGLIEASMQAQQENSDVIYTYCDFDVPIEYQQFEARKPARCISMVVSSVRSESSMATIDLSLNQQQTSDTDDGSLDVSLDFIRHLYLRNSGIIQSKNYALALSCH